jgi:hypothetical protein
LAIKKWGRFGKIIFILKKEWGVLVESGGHFGRGGCFDMYSINHITSCIKSF